MNAEVTSSVLSMWWAKSTHLCTHFVREPAGCKYSRLYMEEIYGKKVEDEHFALRYTLLNYGLAQIIPISANKSYHLLVPKWTPFRF